MLGAIGDHLWQSTIFAGIAALLVLGRTSSAGWRRSSTTKRRLPSHEGAARDGRATDGCRADDRGLAAAIGRLAAPSARQAAFEVTSKGVMLE